MTSTPKVRVRLIGGRALVLCVDSIRQVDALTTCSLVEDVAFIVDSGHGLYVTYPNRTFLPIRQIEYLEAADPLEPVGWSDGERLATWSPGREVGAGRRAIPLIDPQDAVPDHAPAGRLSDLPKFPVPYDFTGEMARMVDPVLQ